MILSKYGLKVYTWDMRFHLLAWRYKACMETCILSAVSAVSAVPEVVVLGQ